MTDIKLLALDLDGTIVKGDLYASKTDLAAVKRAVEAGVYVTIATGRVYYSAKTWADRLGVNAPVIACNGARIRDGQNVIFSECLEKEKVREIMRETECLGARRYLFAKDRIYCTREGLNEAFFTKNGYYEGEGQLIFVLDTMEELINAAGSDTNKFLCVAADKGEHEKLKELSKRVEGCEKVVGDINNMEFTPLGITKASGLAQLAERLGVGIENTMAIGDEQNDIGIIRAAGLGVAMGNAPECVKDAADAVTLSIDENGAAAAIEKYILE